MTTYLGGLVPSAIGPPLSVRATFAGVGVLITGASGFLGQVTYSPLVDLLSDPYLTPMTHSFHLFLDPFNTLFNLFLSPTSFDIF
jgi:hypothetical protein